MVHEFDFEKGEIRKFGGKEEESMTVEGATVAQVGGSLEGSGEEVR